MYKIKINKDLFNRNEVRYYSINSFYSTEAISDFITANSSIQVCESPHLSLKANFGQSFYNYFFKNIDEKKFSIIDAVVDTVNEFLGAKNIAENKLRIKTYIENNNHPPISKFFFKGISECSERALAVHNLFKIAGVESYLMSGPIKINNNDSYHQYNLIKIDKKKYIFDMSILPSIKSSNKQKNRPLILEVENLNEKSGKSRQKKFSGIDTNIIEYELKTSKGNTYKINYYNGKITKKPEINNFKP